MKMNFNKLMLEIIFLVCCIGPTAILVIKNLNDTIAILIGGVGITFLIYMFWYIFIKHKDKF